MAQKFNSGGYENPTSSIGKQINDKFWSRVAVVESKKQKIFSQLGMKETQKKHFGDKIAKYHNIPILDDRNIGDQGIDANGVKMVAGKWYAYDADGARIGEYDTKHEAKAAAGDTGTIKSGNGNLFGSSKDILVQNGAFPLLTEEGGVVNQVNIIRLTLEATVEEYGITASFTKKSLEMDTEKGLLARYSRELGEAQGDTREAQIRNSLVAASEQNRVIAGDAASIGEMGSNDVLSYEDLRMMDKQLKDARCPKTTKVLDGSTKNGTRPIGKGRFVYVGQELLPTLEDMEYNGKAMWTPVEEYAAAGKTLEDEIGRIGSFRFIEVEQMPIYSGQGADSADDSDDDNAGTMYISTGADGKERYDVFPILFVGSDSFATVGFEGDVARVVTVLPKADAHNDRFGKKGSVSISWYYGMLILRPEWIRQIVTCAKIA